MEDKNIVITEYQDNGIATLILNKPEIHNAFDDLMVQQLSRQLQLLQNNTDVKVVVIQAAGKNFCAGADLNWMRRTVDYTTEENKADALQLANLLELLYNFSKPTIALVQGAVLGGGMGLVACCDIAIAATDAYFCLSEIKLGLIPAIISPYLNKAIGERALNYYSLTAEKITAERSYQLGLVQKMVALQQLTTEGNELAQKLLSFDNAALQTAKKLIKKVGLQPISAELSQYTAATTAERRVSPAAQTAMRAFLKDN